jgi:hypothetical protein
MPKKPKKRQKSLPQRLKAIEKSTKRTRKSKTKKGVRVKNPKFSPLKALGELLK